MEDPYIQCFLEGGPPPVQQQVEAALMAEDFRRIGRTRATALPT
jgi:hypothetical protein